jgi:hypothetical protein
MRREKKKEKSVQEKINKEWISWSKGHLISGSASGPEIKKGLTPDTSHFYFFTRKVCAPYQRFVSSYGLFSSCLFVALMISFFL